MKARNCIVLLGCIATSLAATSRPATQPAPPSIEWQPDRPVVPGAKGFTVAPDGRIYCSSTRREDGRAKLMVFASSDDGRTFAALPGVVDSDDAPATDLGDASLIVTASGSIWISYRHNHLAGDRPGYAIKTAFTLDDGRTWTTPATVATSVGERGKPSRGLWSSCLFARSDGIMQCYYDDEDTPAQNGLPGHQWITMKTWDGTGWTNPVTASRAHDPSKLSRDGMMSVVELSPNKLLMAFESVSIKPPHENVIRSVTTQNGGASWSWAREERQILYATPKRGFLAFAPWLAPLCRGRFICVFCTDEDRDVASISGTPPHRIKADIKYVTSSNAGKSWTTSTPLADESHAYYLPGVSVREIDGKHELRVTYLDHATGQCHLVRGTIASE
jgi:hypothetical protein